MRPHGAQRTRVRARGWVLGLCCVLFPAARSSQAQEHPLEETANCLHCHSCPAPTGTDPCLRACSRPREESPAAEPTTVRAPEIAILGELANLYLPVPFDHKGHAAMAEMAGGCRACHHHTPEGNEHPACKSCHSINAAAGDIRKPGLKGAYHRQCLSCHREWSDADNCSICHQPKTAATGIAHAPTPDDLVGRMHPPIQEPETELYRAEREGHSPTQVLFRHKAHIDDYDLKCSDCHREDNCSRCHAPGKNHVQRVRTLDEHHQPCFACHKNDACEACHFDDGGSPPQPFTHADTGWPLKQYHAGASCRACHTAAPYAARDNQCRACHPSGFAGDRFDHAITGLILDETHRGLDCQSCHAEGDFMAAPACADCHEPDEGITHPARRPGQIVAEPERRQNVETSKRRNDVGG